MVKIVKMGCKNSQYKNLTFLTGLLLIIAGLLSFFTLTFTTFFTTIFIGWLLIIGGMFQMVHSVKRYIHQARNFTNKDNHANNYLPVDLLNGLLSIITGGIIIYDPVFTIISLTLLFAFFFIVSGISRIITTFVATGYGNKAWFILNGIASTILGILVLFEWPESSIWFIGLYVSVNFILTGWTYIILFFTQDQNNITQK